MITLYLIRHGETEWNKSGRYQGSTDVALSDMGMAQAEKVASYFKDIPLDGVITAGTYYGGRHRQVTWHGA